MVHTIRFTTTSTRNPIFSTIVLATLHKFKCRAGALGLSLHVQKSLHEPATPEPVIPEVIRPAQCGATPQRLLLPRSDIEILTIFDDVTSSIRDHYTAWVTADPTTIRASHMTDKGKAKPVFREARIRKCLSSASEYKFNTSKPNRLLARTRISIVTWNLGPRRENTRRQ